MFRRNNRIWRKGLVCKSSSFASNQVIKQTMWYNKRILRKGYSVPRYFSWNENYKLLSLLFCICLSVRSYVLCLLWFSIMPIEWRPKHVIKVNEKRYKAGVTLCNLLHIYSIFYLILWWIFHGIKIYSTHLWPSLVN